MSNISAQIASQLGIATQEKLADLSQKNKQLFIGLPKETSFQENRIALTPQSVGLLVNHGHRVLVETQAGEKAHFSDEQYAAAGAEIAYSTEKVFEASIILKVAPPTTAEIDCMHTGQTIMSPLHLPTLQGTNLFKMTEKRITAIAYEYIKDDWGSFPMVRAVSEIAGSSAILIGSEYLNTANNGQGILLGGIAGVPPAKVVILGAGIVGLFAARTALALGAEVRVFDNNLYKLMRLQNNLNIRVFTSIINPAILKKELAEADLAVGAIHSEIGRTPCIVTEEMVANMKPRSVIIDVSIDQGGCFETSEITNHKNPTFLKHNIIHYCVPNIASGVAQTASCAISHVLTPILLNTQQYGDFDKLMHFKAGIRNGAYLYKGYLTNKHLSERFNIKYTNLDLLIASNI